METRKGEYGNYERTLPMETRKGEYGNYERTLPMETINGISILLGFLSFSLQLIISTFPRVRSYKLSWSWSPTTPLSFTDVSLEQTSLKGSVYVK